MGAVDEDCGYDRTKTGYTKMKSEMRNNRRDVVKQWKKRCQKLQVRKANYKIMDGNGSAPTSGIHPCTWLFLDQ